MKGLLLKDLSICKKAIYLCPVLSLIGLLLSIGSSDVSTSVGYVMMIWCVLPLSTFTQDTNDNGMPFLLSLPISRKMYVNEKYMLSVWSGVVGMVVTNVIAIIAAMLIHGNLAQYDFVTVEMTSLIYIAVEIVVLLPIVMRFSGQNKMLIVLAVGFSMGLLVYGVYSVLAVLHLDGLLMIKWNSMQRSTIILLALVVGVIAVLISRQISFRIMAKKEY